MKCYLYCRTTTGINAVLVGDCSMWHLMPSNDDSKLLETLVDVLKLLGILIDTLSGEKQLTSSAITEPLQLVRLVRPWPYHF